MGAIADDLRRPGAIPGAVRSPELRETHVSWVFLTDDRAFKIKKPVDLGFLDFSTLERRREACEAEVALNRRLAPEGVYLGVLPVRRDANGTHRVRRDGDADGEIVDWAVEMRRLPDAERADVMLAGGRLDFAHVERVAEVVARFHETARCDEETARFGSPDAIAVNVKENFRQTRETILEHLSAEEAREIERWQLSFLESRAALFEERVAKGRVRDGHGDLRLEHVYFEAGGAGDVTVLDCIEFNERFRYADVCADVAFLSMDLAWHGRVDLAERLLATYARESNDFDLFRLVDFYESYRAYVRGKVGSILAADERASAAARERARAEVRRYFVLALASERRRVVPPSVVAVGGIIASGKSTIADRLGREMMAPIVEADRTRKNMLGVAPTQPVHSGAWAGAYSKEFTEKVYAEVLRRAGAVLESGRPVILDASFRSEAMRKSARDLAEKHGVPFRFVECRAPREVCIARLEQRAKSRGVSDGRIEIFDDFVKEWEPARGLGEGEHVVIDTARPFDDTLATLRATLDVWPSGLQ